MKDFGVFSSLVRQIAPGGKVLRSWQLKGGISAEMTAVEVELSDGTVGKLVVRWPSSKAEFEMLKLVEVLGLAGPKPYFLEESAEYSSLVMEFVEGVMDFAPADVDGYGRQMAEQLARIHSVDLSGYDLSFLKRRGDACGEVGRTRPYLVDGIVAGLDVGRMEVILAAGPPGKGNAPGLLHGDFWAGNMLWRDGVLVAVIDWEDAALGEPLMDLAQARVELLWLFGAAAVERFTAYYRAKVAIDFTNLPYWDLCAVLRLLRLTQGDWGWLVDFVGEYGREDLTAEAIGEGYGEFVELVMGLIG